MESDHDKLVRIDVETRNQTKLLNQINSKLDSNSSDHKVLKERMDKVEGAISFVKWVVSPIVGLAGLLWSIFHK